MQRQPKPPWLKVKLPGGPVYTEVRHRLRRLELHTVCEEARCPNVGECWSAGTATVMLMGDTCTRGCRFCAVKTAKQGNPLDPAEPCHTAQAVTESRLKYVVLTSVDRDDLGDGGAAHFAETVREIKLRCPQTLVEVLIPDFQGNPSALEILLHSKPDVLAHNLETTRRMTPKVRDPRCSYDQSLGVLRRAKEQSPEGLTKSSLMVGTGEDDTEVYETLRDLRASGVDIATIGQYLRPSPRHLPVQRHVHPDQFKEYERYGLELGFRSVFSGPLVRSSYRAAEVFIRGLLTQQTC